MTNGGEFVRCDGLRGDPAGTVPNLNSKGLNPLTAMIHRFLQRNDIECDRLRQRERHRTIGLAGRGFPPSIEIPVQRLRRRMGAIGIVGGEFAAGGQVGGEGLVDQQRQPV